MTVAGSTAAGAAERHLSQVIIVRHAESRWNAEGRFQGHADSPLSDTGHAQAKEVAQTLGRVLDGGAVTVVASDLTRAHATATAIAETFGVGDVRADPRLREVHVGAWEGLPRSDVARRWPDLLRAWQARQDVSGPGGELPSEAGDRVRRALRESHDGASAEGRTLVAVGHGASLRWAVAAALRWPDGASHLGGLDNAHWSEVYLPASDGLRGWLLHRWNVPPG